MGDLPPHSNGTIPQLGQQEAAALNPLFAAPLGAAGGLVPLPLLGNPLLPYLAPGFLPGGIPAALPGAGALGFNLPFPGVPVDALPAPITVLQQIPTVPAVQNASEPLALEGVEALLLALEKAQPAPAPNPPTVVSTSSELPKPARVLRIPNPSASALNARRRVIEEDDSNTDEDDTDEDGDDEVVGKSESAMEYDEYEATDSEPEQADSDSYEEDSTRRKRGNQAARKRSRRAGGDEDYQGAAPSRKAGSGRSKTSRKRSRAPTESLEDLYRTSRPKRGAYDYDFGAFDADDQDEYIPEPGLVTEQDPWNCLENALPLNSLPTLSLCDFNDPKNLHFSTLLLLDTKAPYIDPIDSPNLWKTPSASILDSSSANAAKAARRTTPWFFGTTSGVEIRPSADTQASQALGAKVTQATTTGRTRRRRRGDDEDVEPQDDEDGMDDQAEEEEGKRRRRRKRKLAEEEDLDDEGVLGSSATGDDTTRTALGPLSTAAKRRMSKGDELVEVKRDGDGNVIMPLKFGAIIVTSLGKVEWKSDKFHSKRYIFPVGYSSKRQYFSIKNPAVRCTYKQDILVSPTDAREPLFRLTCEDMPEAPIEGPTPSGVWAEVLDRVKPHREAQAGRKLYSTVSGPEQYGLSHGVIHKLIQELPDAKLCVNYDPTLFENDANKVKKPRKRDSTGGAGDVSLMDSAPASM